MDTKRIQIAVYSLTFSTETDLLKQLEKKFDVVFCKNLDQIWSALKKENICVLLLEIGKNGKELKSLKVIQERYPKLHIISLGLEKPQQYLINAFKYGSNDFFKIPVNADLLVERILGIVNKNQLKIK